MTRTLHNLSQRVANAPCSWGVLEFDLPQPKIAFPQVLDEIRAAGYCGTELGDWGFLPTQPAALARELAARRLALLGAFVPVDFSNESAHAEGKGRALKTARLMARAAGKAPFIVLADENGRDPERTRCAGRITPELSLDAARWRIFSRGVNEIANSVRRQTGLRTVFHHHCAGFVETPPEIERLLAGTDPELVGLCYDTGHFIFGGGKDALDGFRRFQGRIWHVHFKDCSPALRRQSRESGWDYFTSLKHGIFCELGKGGVDFAALVSVLKQSQYPGWIVVEQDVLPGLGAPKECAERNRRHLRQCGL